MEPLNRTGRRARGLRSSLVHSVVAAACLLLASALAHADSTTPAQLLVVTDINFPPFLFRSDDGTVQGILKDKWALWSQRTGVPVRVEGMEWKAAQNAVQQGHAHVIEALSFTEARTSLYEYSPPYAPIEARVYFHRSISGINDVASMRGFQVGAKEGSACGNWLAERGVKGVQTYADSAALVSAAGAGAVRLFCMDAPAAQYFLFKLGLADQFRQTAPLYQSQFHWAVVKGRTGLRDDIQKGFDLIAPAELEEIDTRWFGQSLRAPFDRQYLAYTAFGFLALVAAGILLLLWNRMLRAQVAARTAELSAALGSVQRYADETSDLYNNAPCGYHSLDLNGVFLEVNNTELKWLGCSREEVVGKCRFADFLTEAGRQVFAELFPRLTAQGSIHDVEFELVGRNGSTRFVLASANMIPGTDGQFLRSRSTLTDITGRRRAEAARASLESQLRESQKMEAIGTLAGGIAHDFNNIIAAILGNAELAREDVSNANPRALESLEEIGKAGRRARDLVQQILSFSRRQPSERRPLALAPLLDESARLLRALLPARVSLDIHCEPQLPAVLADATQLQQVLLNLATNAMQAMRGAAGRIVIRVDTAILDAAFAAMHPALNVLHTRHPGPTLRLAVSDTGAGMAAATLERIFEPFFTTKPVDEGTGLGLSVVHGIVLAHEGEIEVESQPGKGTCFTVYLPVSEARVNEPGPVQSAAAVGADLAPGMGKRILYLDDDESLVFLVKRLLERRGHRVSAHTDQVEALAALRSDPIAFDLVVSDYNMPGMSGLDVARAVRTIRADLPVALVSGFIDEALREQAGGAGVRELIFKADAVEDFCAVVQRLAQEVPK